MWLILCYTVQLVIPNLSTKFENPRSGSAKKSLTENLHMHYIGEMEKGKFEKEGKINISSLIFFYTIYLATLKVHRKFEDPGSNRS